MLRGPSELGNLDVIFAIGQNFGGMWNWPLEIERGVIHWECGMGCSSLHYISLLSELGNIARNPNINNRGHLVIVKLGREVV